MDFRIETHENGKQFFELSEGASYCDPQFCPVCESGENHSWSDLDVPGMDLKTLTYTANDGSVWVGEDYSHDKSPTFGWWETRYRFWKQDFQADEKKKLRRRIEDALRKTATDAQLTEIAGILNVAT